MTEVSNWFHNFFQVESAPIKDPVPSSESPEAMPEQLYNKGNSNEVLPKNKLGAVDEWIAMEHQKKKAIEAINKQQKEQEKANKKVLK